MSWGVSPSARTVVRARLLLALVLAAMMTAGSEAQIPTTTVVLAARDTEVVDTMIRNGSYANANQDNAVLLTRSSSIPEWERRTIFGFETGGIPAGSSIVSANLVLTVRTGLGTAGSTRPVTVYRLSTPFVENQATWMSARSGVAWQTPGGDLGQSYGTVAVTNTAGARVTFDLTALVQQTIANAFESRQTRLALVDVGGGGDAKVSYREYHSSEAGTASFRPQLTIVYRPPTTAATIDVPAGGDLQDALNRAVPGQEVRLAAGAVYTGNFVLPAKTGTAVITLTTNNAILPADGTRITPGYRPQLATLRSPDGYPALATAPAAANYRIVGIAFDANVGGAGDVIALGSHTQTTLAEVPHHIELDRVLLTGDGAAGQKRGISVNAAHVTIANSDIRGIKAIGQDSQAIAGWNTPGPVTISNNYLEAAGENIMFGGAGVALPGVVPSDILVEGNLLTKDVAWRGTSWTVKNLFELKSARRVVVRGNTMEYNWSAGQPGFAVVFTPRNQGGLAPWSVVEDVEFAHNVVRHSGSGFNLLGHDDMAISGQLARIWIHDNLFEDISSANWGGGGHFAQIGGEPRDITIDHNTVLHTGNIVTFYSGSYPNASGVRVTAGPTVGFVFTNNFMKHNAYGIFGNNQAWGNGSLNYYAPGAVVRRNVMASNSSVGYRYPADNFFPNVATFMACFLNPAAGDYRLVSGCLYVGAGTDGADLGRRW
jgi:hypothetical protein